MNKTIYAILAAAALTTACGGMHGRGMQGGGMQGGGMQGGGMQGGGMQGSGMQGGGMHGGMHGQRGMHDERHGAGHAGMMASMDADRDGRLSKDEFMRAHEIMFDRMKGPDGTISLRDMPRHGYGPAAPK